VKEDDMAKPGTSSIEKRIRSVFPDESIARVQVLEYGDEPEVEPGCIAVRVFIARSEGPEGEDADDDIMSSFEKANRDHLVKLGEELPRFVGWVQFQPDSPEDAAKPHHVLKIAIGGRSRPPDEAPEELTSVMTRLGPADLATVDTLITAGFANSRAEVLRWAVGRIRENPAYAQLQDRVHEISELKARF
jgi:hypothetical protein